MRLTRIHYSLLLLLACCAGLMALLPGCVTPTPVDPDAAPDPTALVSTSLVQTAVVEGVRSTTVTWPDEMSTVTYPTLPQPPANCRITRMVYRTYKTPDITAAMGTIEGQERYTIYTSKGLVNESWSGVDYYPLFINKTITFKYDATGRLLNEVTRLWNPPHDTDPDTVSYRYEPGRILYTNSYLGYKRYVYGDILPLDSRGLSQVYPDNYREGHYDAQGYLILGNSQVRRIRGYVSNGNYVEYIDSVGSTGENRTRYLHYVARPNVPNNKPFYGTQSRELIAQDLFSIRLSPYYRDGDKYATRYVYLFDVQGRVRRRIAYGKRLATDWPFSLGTREISLTDYEYACP